MISSHKIKFGNSVAKGFLFGFLLVCVVAFPVVNQQRVSFAMSNSWASGVWTEGNPATSTKIGAYVDTYGWPGGASSPITFNVLSVTGNGYFLQLAGSAQTNGGCTGPEVTIYVAMIGHSGINYCNSVNVVNANFHALDIAFSYNVIHGVIYGYANFYVDGRLATKHIYLQLRRVQFQQRASP